MSQVVRDLIIIGAGPAGLTAAIYAARSRLSTLLLEAQYPGGQAFNTHRIDNYPGFPDGVSGPDLTEAMSRQAQVHGAELLTAQVQSLELSGSPKRVVSSEGEYAAHTVIIATGADPRKLGVPGEAQFTGRGVSYCATCDGPFFRGRRVAVVGGGDSALTDALYLARLASDVVLIHRRDRFRGVKALQERIAADERIRVITPAVVEAIEGQDSVTGVRLGAPPSGAVPAPGAAAVPERVEVEGVFIYVGTTPATAFCPGELQVDAAGYVMADEEMRTSVDGVFAAGDVRSKSLRQVVTAAGDGAIAAMNCEAWLAERGLIS